MWKVVMVLSKYTTELRYICETEAGLSESVGYNGIGEVLNKCHTKIFSFNYPIFDDNYKPILETKILKHFYTREICEETYGLWKLRLDAKMNEIMPYYNQMYKSELLEFNPLYTEYLERTRNTTHEGNENSTLNSVKNENGSGSRSENTDTNNTQLYSDTPQGSLVGVESETYLTNVTKDSGGGSISGYYNSNNKHTLDDITAKSVNSVDDYVESVKGYGGTNASKLLKDFRETFLNIDKMIIEEMEDLFFQLW